MSRLQVLPDITIGSIHKLQGRIMVVHGIWFEKDDPVSVEFYEPATDMLNEASTQEVIAMQKDNMLVLYQPPKGRILKKR